MYIELLHQTVPFVGRTRELEDVRVRLTNPECRLITITGPGGSGKTRLAVEVARQAEASFPHNTVFVGLQSLADTTLLVPAIARAVGLSFYGAEDPSTQLFHFLRSKSLLLILDNFEHLLDGSTLVSDILARADGVKILVTSREALNLQEEWLYPLKGMDTPPSVYSAPPEDYEAIQLFLYHARRMQPNFELKDTYEAVIRICKIAEGLPLAIELAASWLKGLSAAQIATEMQCNLDFLATTTRNVEERHRSLRAVFDQSWKLLCDDERLIFARLTVFRGGFDRAAAEQVAGATLPMLMSLVEKSLIKKQPSDRWDIHELLRQYGEEKLEDFGLLESTHEAHSRYFAVFMHDRQPGLEGPEQLEVLDLIERDFENIRMAWTWAIEHHNNLEIDQMTNSLYHFGFVRSRFRETLELFQQALSQPVTNPRLMGRLLLRRWGFFHWLSQHDYQDALDSINEALEIATAGSDTFEIAFGKLMYAYVLINMQAYAEALTVLHESLAIFHNCPEPYYEAWVMHRIGYVADNLGDSAGGIEWTEKSLALARAVPNRVALSNCLYNLGGSYLLAGDYSKGASYVAEAHQIATTLRHQGQLSHITVMLALAAFWCGDFAEAERLAEEAFRLGEEINAVHVQAYPLALLILLACLRGDYPEATRLDKLAAANTTNTMGFQLYHWARSVLASGLNDEATARREIHEALRLSAPESHRALEISLLPAAAYVLASAQPAQATRLLAWVAESTDSATLWAKEWTMVAQLRDSLRRRLGPSAFDAEWERGAVLGRDSVLTLLRTEFEAAADAAKSFQPLLDEPLTPRELEVLYLLGTGLTNRQIAEQLVIGAGTVKTHTLNIYGKLDVANRSQAILRAQELGLLGQPL